MIFFFSPVLGFFLASSIIQPFIFLLPCARAARAVAQREVRVSWEPPATEMRVFKSRS